MSTKILDESYIEIEQLPTRSMKVEWICEDGVKDVGFYFKEHEKFGTLWDVKSQQPITHWRPLSV